jgi:hypothetical protein
LYRIRSYALTEDSAIYLRPDKNASPPAWTLACKQINNETRKMWYHVNEFRHNLVDLDPKTYHAFARHLKQVDVTVTITMEVGRSRNCNAMPYLLQSFHRTCSLTILAGDMLHEWCKRVHSRASDQARGHGHFRRFVEAGSRESECTRT